MRSDLICIVVGKEGWKMASLVCRLTLRVRFKMIYCTCVRLEFHLMQMDVSERKNGRQRTEPCNLATFILNLCDVIRLWGHHVFFCKLQMLQKENVILQY